MEPGRKDVVNIENNAGEWRILEKTNAGLCTLKSLDSSDPNEFKTAYVSKLSQVTSRA